MNVVLCYMRLLNQALWKTQRLTDLPASLEDWQELIRYSQRQGTEALIYNELLKTQVPEEIKQFMKQHCLSTMMAQKTQLAIMAKTVGALKDGGVDSVVLKGFGLAQLYPLPYLRRWGDLDIYVGPEQYHRAAPILRDTFPEAIHHDEEWEELKHYCFVFPDGNVIEMHRRALVFNSRADEKYYYPIEKQAMQEAKQLPECHLTVEGKEVIIPEPKFNMLFVFMHAWEHFYEQGAGFKQMADVALLCRHLQQVEGMEAYLEKHLKALHLMEAWQMVGYFLHKTLGIQPSEWWLYRDSKHIERLGEQFTEKILSEGLWRPYTSDGKTRDERREEIKKMNVLARKWMTLKGRIMDAKRMYRYAPQYTRHHLWGGIEKGIIRTIHRSQMIDF